MNPTKQREAIAEACGWSFVPAAGSWHLKGRGFDVSVPDYLNDLNAMHGAEKVLVAKGADVLSTYIENILRATIDDPNGDGSLHENWAITHAPAAQRAEAFLRTLYIWED